MKIHAVLALALCSAIAHASPTFTAEGYFRSAGLGLAANLPFTVKFELDESTTELGSTYSSIKMSTAEVSFSSGGKSFHFKGVAGPNSFGLGSLSIDNDDPSYGDVVGFSAGRLASVGDPFMASGSSWSIRLLAASAHLPSETFESTALVPMDLSTFVSTGMRIEFERSSSTPSYTHHAYITSIRNDVVSQVPEPASLGMFLCGLLLVGGARVKRRLG